MSIGFGESARDWRRFRGLSTNGGGETGEIGDLGEALRNVTGAENEGGAVGARPLRRRRSTGRRRSGRYRKAASWPRLKLR